MVLTRLHEMIQQDGRAALVTVVSVSGSSPRDAGARMAVRADGAFAGTVGGGALEWLALAEAQALLAGPADRPFRLIDKALGPDLAQCCGGRVRLSVERLDAGDLGWIADACRHGEGAVTIGAPQPDGHVVRRLAGKREVAALGPGRQRAVLPNGDVLDRFGPVPLAVVLFGAGHVGRALILASAPLPVAVTWVDSRPGAFPGHVPAHVAISRESPGEVLASAPAGAAILAMTHSHALDLEIVATALRAARFAFVGAIGSATKRARFRSQLRQAGIPSDGLVCPIGLPGLDDKEPAVIAASVAVQLMMTRQDVLAALAARETQSAR